MKPKLEKAIVATKVILFILLTGLVIYDISIAVRGLWNATLSNQTTTFSSMFPFIPYAWGVLTFHFFGGKVGRRLFGDIPRLRFAIWVPVSIFFLILSIINLFSTIAIVNFMGEYLLLPLLIGQAFGLLWYQIKRIEQ